MTKLAGKFWCGGASSSLLLQDRQLSYLCLNGCRLFAHKSRTREIITLMSFAQALDNLALRKSDVVRRFEQLITPKSGAELESMAQTSRALTLQNFGRTMRLFAPLYLSNECINNCRYCGFSRDNPILRVTLSMDEVVAEARYLSKAGFRQILLAAGQHRMFVSEASLVEGVRALVAGFAS